MDSPLGASPPDSTTGSIDDGFYYHGQDLEALSDLGAYQQWIVDVFGSELRGKVIEVGAGSGHIAARYADQLERLVLVEPARNLYTKLESRFASKAHVRLLCGPLEAFSIAEFERAGAPFDAALLVNVLEHIEHDLAMVRGLMPLLRPGGALLLFVPALPWLYGTLDESVHHFRRYTRTGLQKLVHDSGFQIEELHFFDLPGVLPWFLAGRVLRQRRFNGRAAKLYDRTVIPIAKAIERHVKPPMGKNLICVARRPLV
jgi:SAM-dependent methyltransferase